MEQLKEFQKKIGYQFQQEGLLTPGIDSQFPMPMNIG